MEISNIGNISQIKSPAAAASKANVSTVKNDDFISDIKKGLESVQKIQDESSQKVQQALTDSSMDPSDAIISMIKAEISMQLTLNVRNKLIDAYQEISRMSI